MRELRDVPFPQWNASLPERGQRLDVGVVTVHLLAAVASEIEGLEGGTNSLFRRNERAIQWAAELLQQLTRSTRTRSRTSRQPVIRCMRYNVSWSNRRAFVHGRAHAPDTAAG